MLKHSGQFRTEQSNCHRLETINKINSRDKAFPISTFDFSTLYANIPCHKLKFLLRELIKFCLNGREKEFIGISKHDAIWTNNQQKYRFSVDKTSLKLAIDYLLDNWYFTLGSTFFRQLIGIPMMSDPASFMANLVL